MPDEYPPTLRQADQVCADFAAIGDDLDSIKVQLARIPTRMELSRLLLLETLATAVLVPCRRGDVPVTGVHDASR
jgi:hypothetical protein